MYMILNGQDCMLQPLYVAKAKFIIFEIPIRITTNFPRLNSFSEIPRRESGNVHILNSVVTWEKKCV
jgi:hypothetical protein